MRQIIILATSATLADYQRTLMGGGVYRLLPEDFQNADLVIPAEDLPRYSTLARGHNTRETTSWEAEREHNARKILQHINATDVYFDDGGEHDNIGTSAIYGAGLTLSIVKTDKALALDCPSGSERAALGVALELKEFFKGRREVLVAYCDRFDRLIQMFCKKHGLECVNIPQPRFASRYQGATEAFCDVDTFEQAGNQGDWKIPLDKITIWDEQAEAMRPIGKMTRNEYLLLQNANRPKSTLLGRFNGEMVEAILQPVRVFGVMPMGVRQKFMIDALTNEPKNRVVIVEGLAGVGKTLLAAAAAYQLVQDGEFARIIYLKNNTEVSDKEGFLPGTQEQKCDHYFRAIYQAIARVAEIRNKDEGFKKAMSASPVEIGRTLARQQGSQFEMTVDTINDERGTTYDNSVLIIDEAQNFSPNQLRTVISRSGRDSLTIVLGDISQIDGEANGYHNGLTQAMNRLRGAENVYVLRLLDPQAVQRGTIARTVAELWP
ncbi:PhoH family protein [Candidatus Saccharibacteria bacterium]|nr:PhoH family protein [Candidatus Saccharibacteria bacterium]